MEEIKNEGQKGRFVMWVIIAFILLISMFIWIYQMNFKLLP